jgi:phytoene dehydrogenase-like protein
LNRIVIVGGGVSGLAAGCLLARRGMDVTVFEANEKTGGCCATTRVEDYTFHDGAVYLAAPRLLDRAFAMLGLDRAALVPLRKITSMFSTSLPDGTIVTVRDRHDIQIEGAVLDQSLLDIELQRMLNRWAPVLDTVVDHLMAALSLRGAAYATAGSISTNYVARSVRRCDVSSAMSESVRRSQGRCCTRAFRRTRCPLRPSLAWSRC